MWFENVVAAVSNALYSYILIIALVAGGLYFTVRTKGAQIRLLGAQIGAVTEKKKDKNGISSFQALIREETFPTSFSTSTLLTDNDQFPSL